MSLGHGANIVRDGLVLHLDAANSKSYPGSGTAWSDLSGNGNNGIATNGASYVNNYFVFDGVNDYISLGDLDLASSFSLSIWFKGNSSQPDSYVGLLNKGSSGNFGNWGLYGDAASSYVRFGFVNSESGSQRETSNSSYADIKANTWVNYVGTYDFSNLRLYRNGIQIAAISETSTPVLTNDVACVGGRIASSDYFFSGQVAISSIYNRALTAAEVRQNFESTRSRYGI